MKIHRKSLAAFLAAALVFGLGRAAAASELNSPDPAAAGGVKNVRVLGFEECLEISQINNHQRPASRMALAAAEYQHRQALAGYWPQLRLKGAYMHLDEAPNFVFPASTINIPAQTITTPPGTALISIPPGVIGPDAVQLPVAFPGQQITTSAAAFEVPRQDIKLMDPDTFSLSLDAKWLIYDGGMRRGYREQSQGLVDVMRQEARRTDLEIVDSVKRYYYGAVLARQVRQLGRDTLARMEATLRLTETMYKEGSGRVKKTDFLDNRVMVESLRAMLAQLEKNVEMAQSALANTMGLSWRESVQPEDEGIAFAPYQGDLDDLVGTAYSFSPDWGKLQAGLQAAEGRIRTARSGYFPKLALTGELHRWWNDYDAGIATDQNKQGWSVGVGVEIPIFDGFLTANRLGEAKARLERLKEEKLLLKEGLGLQIKDTLLNVRAAGQGCQATQEAMQAAVENRELNIRAYQNELVDTEKVIRAQLTEAFISAQHYKTRYDYAVLLSKLDLIVGAEVLKRLGQ